MNRPSSFASRTVRASPARVFRALIEPAFLQTWMTPPGMSGEIHLFEAWQGGRFRISLTYSDVESIGKSIAHTDNFAGTFTAIEPPSRIEQVFEIESTDPTLQGQMMLRIDLTEIAGNTLIEATQSCLPSGFDARDTQLVWELALRTLATLVEPPLPAVEGFVPSTNGHGN